jgi:hypothetical protein
MVVFLDQNRLVASAKELPVLPVGLMEKQHQFRPLGGGRVT